MKWITLFSILFIGCSGSDATIIQPVKDKPIVKVSKIDSIKKILQGDFVSQYYNDNGNFIEKNIKEYDTLKIWGDSISHSKLKVKGNYILHKEDNFFYMDEVLHGKDFEIIITNQRIRKVVDESFELINNGNVWDVYDKK